MPVLVVAGDSPFHNFNGFDGFIYDPSMVNYLTGVKTRHCEGRGHRNHIHTGGDPGPVTVG